MRAVAYPAVLIAVAFLAIGCRFLPPAAADQHAKNRQALFDEIRPVKLANCDFARVGDEHDGGYLICQNLVDRAQTLYSYGVNATDEWGCRLSAQLKLPVHQYDCFNLARPPCDGATPVFHEECVGPAKTTEKDRAFDTIDAQIKRNGDAGKTMIMKMDVEGSEWASFMAAPDAVFEKIDQLVVEFHGVDEAEYVETIRKLKRHFHVANLHYNNWSCTRDRAPFPATAFEILFVNKQLGVVDSDATAVVPNPLDAPNAPARPDCQAVQPSEAQSRP